MSTGAGRSRAPTDSAPGVTALAVLALVCNAFVWGTSWWPFRWLQERGVHPLWATTIAFVIASLVIVAARPQAVRQVITTPALWVLVAAAGITNASFNWAVTIGDVVRVVLLFYLMPLWAVLLARILLGEPFTARALVRVGLALAGAAIVLWPVDGSGLPLPETLADWLGIAGGFSFALNNVMLRREAHRPEEGRALAMFFGGAVVALLLAAAFGGDPASGGVGPLPAAEPGWVAMVGALAVAFLAANLALQYGAARLPAQRTAVVMLTEVVFAAASSVALGAGTLNLRLVAGGALIIASALVVAGAPRPGR